MKVETKKINKHTTQIYINGEYQGSIIKGNYGFWYSIDGIHCRTKGDAISFILDKYEHQHLPPLPNKTN